MRYLLFFCIVMGVAFAYPYGWTIETEGVDEDTFLLYQWVTSYTTHFTTDKDGDGNLEFYKTIPVWSKPTYIHINEWRKAQNAMRVIGAEDEHRLVNDDTLFVPILYIEYRGRKFRMKIDYKESK